MEIRSCYGLWMEQVQLRRSQSKDLLTSTLGSWPYKKSGSMRKMNKLPAPRFENWEGRLIARFSKTEEMSKTLERGLCIR